MVEKQIGVAEIAEALKAAPDQDALRGLWIEAIKPYVLFEKAVPYPNVKAIPTQCQAVVSLMDKGRKTDRVEDVALWMYGMLLDTPADYLVYPAFPVDIWDRAPTGFDAVIASIELFVIGKTGFVFTSEPNEYIIRDVVKFMMQKPHTFHPWAALNKPKKQSLVGRILSPSAECLVNKNVFNTIRVSGGIVPPVQIYLGDVLKTYPDQIDTLVGTYIRAKSVLSRVTMKEIYPKFQKETSNGLALSDGRVLHSDNPRNYSIGKWSFVVDPQENGVIKWGDFIMRRSGGLDTNAVYFHQDYFHSQLRDKLAGKSYCMPTHDTFSIFRNTAYLHAGTFTKPSAINCFRANMLHQHEKRMNPRLSLHPNPEEIIDRIVVCVPTTGIPYGPEVPASILTLLVLPTPLPRSRMGEGHEIAFRTLTGENWDKLAAEGKSYPQQGKEDECKKEDVVVTDTVSEPSAPVDVFVGGDFGDGKTEAVIGIRPILAMLYDLMIVDPKTKEWTVLSDGQILNGDYALEVKSVFGLVSAYARNLRQSGNWLDAAVMRHRNGQARFVELFHDVESGPSVKAIMTRIQAFMMDEAPSRPTETTTLFEITRKFELNFHRISGNPELSQTIRLGTANVIHIQGVSSIVLKLVPVNGYSELEVWGIIRDCLIAHLFISDSANTLMIVRSQDDADGAPPSIGAVYVARHVNEHGAVTSISCNDTHIPAAAIITEQNRIDEVFDMLSTKKEV